MDQNQTRFHHYNINQNLAFVNCPKATMSSSTGLGLIIHAKRKETGPDLPESNLLKRCRTGGGRLMAGRFGAGSPEIGVISASRFA